MFLAGDPISMAARSNLTNAWVNVDPPDGQLMEGVVKVGSPDSEFHQGCGQR